MTRLGAARGLSRGGGASAHSRPRDVEPRLPAPPTVPGARVSTPTTILWQGIREGEGTNTWEQPREMENLDHPHPTILVLKPNDVSWTSSVCALHIAQDENTVRCVWKHID